MKMSLDIDEKFYERDENISMFEKVFERDVCDNEIISTIANGDVDKQYLIKREYNLWTGDSDESTKKFLRTLEYNLHNKGNKLFVMKLPNQLCVRSIKDETPFRFLIFESDVCDDEIISTIANGGADKNYLIKRDYIWTDEVIEKFREILNHTFGKCNVFTMHVFQQRLIIKIGNDKSLLFESDVCDNEIISTIANGGGNKEYIIKKDYIWTDEIIRKFVRILGPVLSNKDIGTYEWYIDRSFPQQLMIKIKNKEITSPTDIMCCFCFGKSSKTCGKCKNARYCSRECQKKDWEFHKSTCIPNIGNFCK